MADDQIVGLIIFIGILVIGYLCAYPYIRGPVANMEIHTTVDSTGNISDYSIDLQFGDDISYSQFLSEMKDSNLASYELRATNMPDLFLISNDSANQKITIKAVGPFDPNTVTTFMHLNMSQDYWEFADDSVSGSSFLPEKYINKLTYTLTIPSEIIDTTTLDNSTDWIYGNKQLTWTMDQNKNWFNPKGEAYNPPKIYVKFQVPDPNRFPWGLVVLGAGIMALLGLGYVAYRRKCTW